MKLDEIAKTTLSELPDKLTVDQAIYVAGILFIGWAVVTFIKGKLG